MKIPLNQRWMWLRCVLAIGLVVTVTGCGSGLAPPPAPKPQDNTPVSKIDVEAESAPDDAPVMNRSAASGGATVSLKQGASVSLPFDLNSPASYTLSVRYSNDGLPDRVAVSIDGTPTGEFVAQNTRHTNQGPGEGWNDFVMSPASGPLHLSRDTHTVVVTVTGPDREGVEIDGISLSLQP